MAVEPQHLKHLTSLPDFLPLLLADITSTDDEYVYMIELITRLLVPYINDESSCVDVSTVTSALEQVLLHPKVSISSLADEILTTLDTHDDMK